jgi:effector-binding domain-containing protein
MKKRVFISLAVILATIAGIFFLYPVRVKKMIVVPYAMFKSGEQLNNLKNIVKWFPPFKISDTAAIIKGEKKQSVTSGEYSAEVSSITMFSSVITAAHKGKKKAFAFVSLADSTQSFASTITLTYTTNLFSKWFSKSTVEKNAEESMENLKEYMTDTKSFYGFDIQEEPVADTAFLFSRTVVPVNERRTATIKLFEQLIKYAEKNNAGYTGNRIYYTLKAGKEITIFASIGVSNYIETTGDDIIQYKKMPLGKRLISTTYQGPLNQSTKAFNALELFKADHNLTSMAIPFQKFLSDGYDFEDNQIVQLKVYYPVY